MNKVEGVILDWAGTAVDFGSFAPTQVLIDAFKSAFDFSIDLAEARVPMGLWKWNHIQAVGQLSAVKARWVKQFGNEMSKEDVDAIYHAFMPLQIARVVDFSTPIAGVVDTINWLRQRKIAIGSCSGYPRAVMDVLIPAAAAHGYQPDYCVASDDLAAGARPGPWMALQNVIGLGLGSVAHCVKVDDAVPGIAEGLNAGMWTVGLSVSGNEFGATYDEFLSLSDLEVAERRKKAEAKLRQAGAHYVIDSLKDLPQVIDEIEARLAKGEKP